MPLPKGSGTFFYAEKLNYGELVPIYLINGYKCKLDDQCEKDGVTMVWHYNVFLSYDVEPVEEKRVWLDADTANLTQVDLNAYFLSQGKPCDDGAIEQLKLVDQLYASAMGLWKEETKKDYTLDRRA